LGIPTLDDETMLSQIVGNLLPTDPAS